MTILDEAFRARYNNGSQGEVPCLFLGLSTPTTAIICRADGQIEIVQLDKLRLDWRYDGTGWIDYGVEEAIAASNDLSDISGDEDDGTPSDIQGDIRSVDQPPRRRGRPRTRARV